MTCVGSSRRRKQPTFNKYSAAAASRYAASQHTTNRSFVNNLHNPLNSCVFTHLRFSGYSVFPFFGLCIHAARFSDFAQKMMLSENRYFCVLVQLLQKNEKTTKNQKTNELVNSLLI
jgi:hypothetical protein